VFFLLFALGEGEGRKYGGYMLGIKIPPNIEHVFDNRGF
jgi:hypothetical protein